jgi:hypothetical protein
MWLAYFGHSAGLIQYSLYLVCLKSTDYWSADKQISPHDASQRGLMYIMHIANMDEVGDLRQLLPSSRINVSVEDMQCEPVACIAVTSRPTDVWDSQRAGKGEQNACALKQRPQEFSVVFLYLLLHHYVISSKASLLLFQE